MTVPSQGSAATYNYVFALPTPLDLPNGTYWVEISNDTRSDADDNWAWVRADLDAANGIEGTAFRGRFTAWSALFTGELSLILHGFESQ